MTSPGLPPTESHDSSLLRIDLPAIPLEASGQHVIDPFRIVLLFKAPHKIVGKPHQERSTTQSRLDRLLKPLVQAFVQEGVTSNRGNHPPWGGPLFRVRQPLLLQHPSF
jgi:hypothetical protein